MRRFVNICLCLRADFINLHRKLKPHCKLGEIVNLNSKGKASICEKQKAPEYQGTLTRSVFKKFTEHVKSLIIFHKLWK